MAQARRRGEAPSTPRCDPLVCPTCGYESTTTSPAIARHAFARHSCELTVRLREKRARGEAIRATRAPVACSHKAQHKHGTALMYDQDGCGCGPCRKAGRQKKLRHRRRVAEGLVVGYVDATPSREHVHELLKIMSLEAIAKQAYMSVAGVRKIRDGRSTRVQRETEVAILAIPLRPIPADINATIDATGARRTLQGLIAAGWPTRVLADGLGVQQTNVTALLNGQANITRRRRMDIEHLARKLVVRVPPEAKGSQWGPERCREFARRRGWVPLAAWDNIDDPDEKPKGLRVA